MRVCFARGGSCSMHVASKSLFVSFRHGRKSFIREAYEEHFLPVDSREVTVQRVVNIVEKRSHVPRPGVELERRFNDDQWYGGPRDYHDGRGYCDEGSYPASDQRCFEENPNFGTFHRNSSPHRSEVPYAQQCYSRDDLRHQLSSRKSGRGSHFHSRGRGGPSQRKDHDDYRNPPPTVIVRDRSPGRRDGQPPARSASSTKSRNLSPDKSYRSQQGQQKHKPNLVTSHTPSSSVEGSPQSSGSSKEKTPASAAESEEAAAASVEPKLTPEQDIKARRLEAIKAKALEIETHYRKDCETFRTVVNMLVEKEPSLDKILQEPLDKNLLEIKQRCLDALRNFVKELDEVIEQPDT